MKKFYLTTFILLSSFLHFVGAKDSFDRDELKKIADLYVQFPFQDQCAKDVYRELRDIEISHYAIPQKNRKSSQKLMEMEKKMVYCARKSNKKDNGEYFYLSFYRQYLEAQKKSLQALFEDYPRNFNITPLPFIFSLFLGKTQLTKDPKSSHFLHLKDLAIHSQRNLQYLIYENKQKIKEYHPAFATEIFALYGHSWLNILPMFSSTMSTKQEIKHVLLEIYAIPHHQQNDRFKTLDAYFDVSNFSSRKKTLDSSLHFKEIFAKKKNIVEIFNAHMIYTKLALKSMQLEEVSPHIEKATEIFPENDFLKLLKEQAVSRPMRHLSQE